MLFRSTVFTPAAVVVQWKGCWRLGALVLRSVGGFMMTAAHVSFAVLVWRIVRQKSVAERYEGPTLFTSEMEEVNA